MINNQLLGYVKQQLSLNTTKNKIVTDLKSGGWNESDINEAFMYIETSTMPKPNSVPPVVSGVMSNFTSSQVNFSDAPTHKSRKIIPIIIVLILLFLAGGVAGYAYYTGFFVTLPSLLSNLVDKTKTATTGLKYDVTVSVDFSEIKSAGTPLDSLSSIGINSKQFILKMNGSSDISDLKNPKFSSVLSFNLGGGVVSAEAEFRLVDKVLYAQLLKTPILGTFSLPTTTIAPYINKWFSAPTMSSISYSVTTLTDEQKDYIRKLFIDSNFIKPVAKLVIETVGGEPSYHFSFDFDKVAFVSYLESLKSYMQTIDKNNPTYSTLDSKMFTDALNQVKDFKGEIWIGRSDKLVHKLSISFGVQPDLTKTEQVKINIISVISDYNQPVSIIAPTESTPFETVISNSQQKGKEASIKANMSNMRAQAEIFYDKNNKKYSSFCLSKEAKDARANIEISGGTEFVCKDKSTAYVIRVKLSDSSGYWCVDSTGANKSTTIIPSSTVCPAI